MTFVFSDKSKVEMEIITDLLHEENIPYKIKRYVMHDFFFEEDEDEDNFVIIEELYEIDCYTDLYHFDFINALANKRIKDRIKLERCFMKKVRKQDVQRIYKKNITNTNNKNRT